MQEWCSYINVIGIQYGQIQTVGKRIEYLSNIIFDSEKQNKIAFSLVIQTTTFFCFSDTHYRYLYEIASFRWDPLYNSFQGLPRKAS